MAVGIFLKLFQPNFSTNINFIGIFKTFVSFRILGGVTLSPRPNIYCKENISDFSVCDSEQKEIDIDENYCLSVDHHGKPVDIYSKSELTFNTNKILYNFEILF